MPTLTETLHEQCRALLTQRGMFMEDLLAALRLIAGRTDGTISELMAGYGGLQYLLLNGLPFSQWDFSSGVFSTVGMTFTRAGDRQATVTDFEGTVWKCRTNEMRLQGLRRLENILTPSEDLTSASWNKSQGGGVSTAAAPGTPDPFGSTKAFKLTELAGTGVHVTFIDYVPDLAGNYIGSYYIKAAERTKCGLIVEGAGFANENIVFDLSSGTVVSGAGQIAAVGGGWYRVWTVAATNVLGNPCAIKPAIVDNSGNLSYLGDGVSGIFVAYGMLERAAPGQTTPSAYISNGALSSPYHGFFADGVAYYTTDRTGLPITPSNSQGLLVESASQNIALYSNDLSNAAWAVAGAGATKVGVGTLADALGYYRVNVGTVGGVFSAASALFQASMSWSAATTYTVSCYAQAVAGTVTVRLGAHQGIGVDDGTGDIVLTTTPQRLTFTFTTGAAFVGNISLRPGVAGGVQGDILVGGFQAEAKSLATTYIPTSGSAVGRNDENCYTVNAAIFDRSASSLYAEAICYGATGGAVNGAASVNDGSDVNRIDCRPFQSGSSLSLVSSAAVNVLSASGAPAVVNTLTKFATAQEAANFAAVKDGGVLGTSAVGAAPTGLNRLDFGALEGGNFRLDGLLRKVRYYPSRLPNATLQSLTA